MSWLLFVIFALGILSFSDFSNKKASNIAVVIAGILLSMTAGFRNVGGVDTDYAIYKDHYDGKFGTYFYELFEPGYNASVWFSNQVGLSFNVFVFILTSICVIFFLRIIVKYSEYPMLSVIIYMGTYFLFYNMVLMRQMVSVTMFLYCLHYIVEKNALKFVFCFFVGALFHLSIVVLLPAYFIIRFFKLSIWNMAIILGLGILLKVVGVVNIAMYSGDVIATRIVRYLMKGDDFSLNIMEYAKMVIMISGILFLFSKLKGQYINEILIKMYLIFCVLIFSFGNIEIFFRMAMYFDLSILFLIPLFLKSISMTKFSRIVSYFVVLIFFAFSFVYRVHNFDDGEFYQYKFFFL